MKFDYGRLSTISVGGDLCYGAITDKGFIDLSARFRGRWPSLRNVIEDNALEKLTDASGALTEDIGISELTFSIPVPNPEKIICVGVNYPDRNEEYKDGQATPQNPSLFPRFPRSFVGHETTLTKPPESPQLDYEGEIALVIGKAGRRIPESDAMNHIAAVTLCNEGTIRDWVRHAKLTSRRARTSTRQAP